MKLLEHRGYTKSKIQTIKALEKVIQNIPLDMIIHEKNDRKWCLQSEDDIIIRPSKDRLSCIAFTPTGNYYYCYAIILFFVLLHIIFNIFKELMLKLNGFFLIWSILTWMMIFTFVIVVEHVIGVAKLLKTCYY